MNAICVSDVIVLVDIPRNSNGIPSVGLQTFNSTSILQNVIWYSMNSEFSVCFTWAVP